MENTNDNRTQIESDNKSITNKLAIFIVILTVIIAFSVVLLFFVKEKQSALEGADSIVRLSAQSGFECEFAEAQKLYPFSEGVLKLTVDRIAYLTISGNEVYSSTVSYQNPNCFVSGNRAIVADIDGYAFSVIDNEGVVFSKATENKIKACFISENGKCAIITDDDDSYGQVYVYSEKGDFICNWISYDSGYPISCVFSDGDEFLAITSINTNGADFESFLKVLSITNENGTYKAADYAVYAETTNSILSSVCYCNPKFYTFSTDSIYMVSDNQMSELALDYGSFNYVFTVDGYLFMIYSDGVGQLNKISIMDSSNRIVYDSDLGTQIHAYGYYGNRAAVCVDDRIFVFNTAGDVLADLSVDEDVLRIGFISSDKIIIVSTGGVHTYNI